MSRFIIPVIDSLGNKVYFQTSNHKGQQSVDGYQSVIMWLEKNGFKVSPDVPKPVEKPVESASGPRKDYCYVHNCEMQEREGKFGKFYSHSKQEGEAFIYCNGKGYK